MLRNLAIKKKSGSSESLESNRFKTTSRESLNSHKKSINKQLLNLLGMTPKLSAPIAKRNLFGKKVEKPADEPVAQVEVTLPTIDDLMDVHYKYAVENVGDMTTEGELSEALAWEVNHKSRASVLKAIDEQLKALAEE